MSNTKDTSTDPRTALGATILPGRDHAGPATPRAPEANGHRAGIAGGTVCS